VLQRSRVGTGRRSLQSMPSLRRARSTRRIRRERLVNGDVRITKAVSEMAKMTKVGKTKEGQDMTYEEWKAWQKGDGHDGEHDKVRDKETL